MGCHLWGRTELDRPEVTYSTVIALDLETMQNEGDKYKKKKGRKFRIELKKKKKKQHISM